MAAHESNHAQNPSLGDKACAAANCRWTVGDCATLACVLEATAPKPGNVHRGADFDDLGFVDLLVSAVAIRPAMEHAARSGVGEAVYRAVAATRAVVATNSNLGIVLALAPLAAVPHPRPITPPAVRQVLAGLTPHDSRRVWEAIQLARPGGMGNVDSMDVAGPPPEDLLAAMRAAQDRDLIARQYVDGFALVLEEVVPLLQAGRVAGWTLTTAIIQTHVTLLARYGDSLIARKCGPTVARQAAAMAQRVLTAGQPGEEAYEQALADLDFWLRSDGHRRNPGTTADLVAAGLFVLLRDGRWPPPWR
jgi:triphosphoribosyl-dephospho-CoA synthase